MGASKEFDEAHDFPPMSPPSGKPILVWDKDNPAKFTDLIDTFNSYVGLAGMFLMVNLTEDGLTVTAATGSDKTYVHTQSVAALEWPISHNLNKYPSVIVVNSNGDNVITNIHYVDLNNLLIRNDIAKTGKVYCN